MVQGCCASKEDYAKLTNAFEAGATTYISLDNCQVTSSAALVLEEAGRLLGNAAMHCLDSLT
jgi:hypothetical protein